PDQSLSLSLVIMDSLNLSLDEIIKQSRSTKGRGGEKGFKSDGISGRRSGGGGAARRTGGGGPRTGGSFTKSVPSGKWRHDKFEQNESGGRGSGGHVSAARGSTGGLAVGSNRKVRVNVSNLAPTVTTADLEELFSSKFPIDSAVCHFGETGEHLGTGDVVMKMNQALKAIEEFKGVSVDGNRLVLAIVDGGAGSIFDRVQVVKRVSGGGIEKRSRDAPVGRGQANRRGGERKSSNGGGRHPLDRFDEGESRPRQGGRGGGAGGAGRGGKKKMTEEELDAELNNYMKSKGSMEH
ncbi:hypothetical protein PRIPAC_97961, partial [Pristionchus pacificus]